MHARHRVPANGFRPNPIGIGGGGGFPAYRNYNNRSGSGRGHQKNFQSGPPPVPPPPSRRGDVFMEAGRLATEYLISKGLLPANVLSGKWQNGGDYVPDAVSGTGGPTRRSSDDYSYSGLRGRRRIGAFKNPGFELNREIDRSGSSSAKVMDSSSDKQGEDNTFSGSPEKLQDGEDGHDLESKSCEKNENENENENELPDNNVCLKSPISDVSPEGVVDSPEKSEGSKNMNTGIEEMTMDDDNNNEESEKPTVKEDTPMENFTEENNGGDLLSFIRFHKVPTRTRSSLTINRPKINPVLIPNDENTNETHNSVDVSVGDEASDEKQESNPEPDIPDAPSAEEVAELDNEYESEEHVEHRGEKRPLCAIDDGEGSKKPRDGSPSNLQEVNPCNDYSERNHLFPDSFKICDLNLMEASNGNKNLDANSNGKTDEKDVEVIDLERDSEQDNKVFSNSERMDETIFTDLESFPDSMQRVNEMPQDGYGLMMISELLEADIPNCSGSGVNPMHNQIGLQNDDGILDDDESIYMSLGEIPISFVPVWDQQPTRGYDKPY